LQVRELSRNNIVKMCWTLSSYKNLYFYLIVKNYKWKKNIRTFVKSRNYCFQLIISFIKSEIDQSNSKTTEENEMMKHKNRKHKIFFLWMKKILSSNKTETNNTRKNKKIRAKTFKGIKMWRLFFLRCSVLLFLKHL
jgi:hypothetical protein